MMVLVTTVSNIIVHSSIVSTFSFPGASGGGDGDDRGDCGTGGDCDGGGSDSGGDVTDDDGDDCGGDTKENVTLPMTAAVMVTVMEAVTSPMTTGVDASPVNIGEGRSLLGVV